MSGFSPAPPRGDFIAGRFAPPAAADGEARRADPGDLRRAYPPVPYARDHVRRAVSAARDAFPRWSRTAPERRAEVLRAYGKAVERRAEEIAATITAEMGKPLWEARQEVGLMTAKVRATLDRSMRLVDDIAVPGGRCRFKPRGVLAVLGPFNFPGHLPGGHILPALAAGNAVVFKPSERAPTTGQLLAEAMAEAGAPPGVFNLVQGPGEIGAALAAHEDVDGVLFTGSYAVGRRLQQLYLNRPGKILALEMGGKNAAVVLADADLDLAVREIAFGAFVTSGQRCTATSRAIVDRRVEGALAERLLRRARALRVGYGFEEGVFMGPLATEDALEKFLAAQGRADWEGFETLLPCARVKGERPGWYAGPALHRAARREPTSRLLAEELFGPQATILAADGLEEAMALANESAYGLAMSVFTRDEAKYQEAFARSRVGVLNWNRATVGASGALPFGGLGRSGNDRPTALFAPYYCTYPVASLEGAEEPFRAPPGFEEGAP